MRCTQDHLIVELFNVQGIKGLVVGGEQSDQLELMFRRAARCAATHIAPSDRDLLVLSALLLLLRPGVSAYRQEALIGYSEKQSKSAVSAACLHSVVHRRVP